MEQTAIETVFGARASKIPLVAYKAYWGETVAAGGALQLAGALADLEDNTISATPGYTANAKAKQTKLNLSGSPVSGKKLRTALVHSFGPTGQNTAMVIQKPD
jgi:3-oxoacyl-(acyl-carrier-protein) synthase